MWRNSFLWLIFLLLPLRMARAEVSQPSEPTAGVQEEALCGGLSSHGTMASSEDGCHFAMVYFNECPAKGALF
jgi:hypothetical protein